MTDPTEKFQAGQKVQLRQHEFLHDSPRPVANPPVQPGPVDFWLYATVKDILPSGLVRVRVNHPGNWQHGGEYDVKPEDLRTREDLIAAAAEIKTGNPGWDEKLKEHHAVQIERLKPDA